MPTPEPHGFQTHYESPPCQKLSAAGPWNRLAVISSATAIISIPTLMIIWASQAWSLLFSSPIILVPLTPLLLGVMALGQIRERGGKGQTLAVVGITLGSAATLLLLGGIAFLMTALAAWAAS